MDVSQGKPASTFPVQALHLKAQLQYEKIAGFVDPFAVCVDGREIILQADPGRGFFVVDVAADQSRRAWGDLNSGDIGRGAAHVEDDVQAVIGQARENGLVWPAERLDVGEDAFRGALHPSDD